CLGPGWFDVLEVLQNAEFVLSKGATHSHPSSGRKASAPSSAPGGQASAPQAYTAGPGATSARNAAFADLDPDSIAQAVQRLFECSKNLEDESFRDFVTALCKLSSEMVGMQAVAVSDAVAVQSGGESTEDVAVLPPVPTPTHLSSRSRGSVYAHRRRAS